MSIQVVSGIPKLFVKKVPYSGRVKCWIPFVLKFPTNVLNFLGASPPYSCYYRSDQGVMYISDYTSRIYRFDPKDPVVVTTGLGLRRAVESSIQFKNGKFYKFCSGYISFTGDYVVSDSSIYECDLSGNCTPVANFPSPRTFTLSLSVPSDNYSKIAVLFGQVGPYLPSLIFWHLGGSRFVSDFYVFDSETHTLEYVSSLSNWSTLLAEYDAVVMKNKKIAYVFLFKADPISLIAKTIEVKYVDLVTFDYGDVTSFYVDSVAPDILYSEGRPVIKFSALAIDGKEYIVGVYVTVSGEIKQIVFNSEFDLLKDFSIPVDNLYIYSRPEAPSLIPLITGVYDYSKDSEDNTALMSMMDVRSDSQVYCLYNYYGTMYQPESGETELLVVMPESMVSEDKPIYSYMTKTYMTRPSVTLTAKDFPVVALGNFRVYALKVT